MSTVVGLFADSRGDLETLDRAIRLLADKGSKRFFFAGGNYADIDAWVDWKNAQARSQTDYTDANFLEDVAAHLLDQPTAERPAAFGTYYELVRSASDITRTADRVVRTPERGSLAYQNTSTPNKVMDMLGDVLCCLVHDKNDLDKEDMINAVVLMHGNEAEPRVVQIGPRFFITPGQLSGPNPSVAQLEFDEKGLRFVPLLLTGEPAGEPQVLAVSAKTKISVK